MKIVALLCLMKSNVCVNFLKVQPFRSFKGLKKLSKSTSRRMHDVERERERAMKQAKIKMRILTPDWFFISSANIDLLFTAKISVRMVHLVALYNQL